MLAQALKCLWVVKLKENSADTKKYAQKKGTPKKGTPKVTKKDKP